MARIRKCGGGCPYYGNNAGQWPWPRCMYAREQALALAAARARAGDKDGAVILLKAAMGAVVPDLDDAFMEGPPENCPGGFWKDLTPVDLEAERKVGLEAVAERFTRQNAPLVARLEKPELVQALVEMVEAGTVPGELAEKIAEKCGLSLDSITPAAGGGQQTGISKENGGLP